MISVRFQGKPFNIRVIQVYAPTSNAKEAEVEWSSLAFLMMCSAYRLNKQGDNELFNFSFFSVTGWGIDLNYCDIEWFALETNRDHSVISEIASKYCSSDSFVDHDGYSISSEGFLPAVIDIMVI